MEQTGTERPVPVAMVGLDHPHAAGYLRILQHLEKTDLVRLVACYDADPAAKVTRIQAFDPGGGDEDYEAMLAGVPRVQRLEALFDYGPAAAIVLQPNRKAPAAAEAIMRAGLDVLVDKPAGLTGDDVRRIADQAAAAGVRFTSGYMWRCHPAVEQVRRWIQAGYLGTVMDLEARLLASHVGLRGPGHYLFDRHTSGGGMLHWLGVHWLDLMLFFMDAPVESVQAETGGYSHHELDVEERATVMLRFAGGASAVLHTGYVLEGGYDSYFALRGTLGRVDWQPMEQGPLNLYSRHEHLEAAPSQQLQLSPRRLDVYAGQLGLAYVRDFLLEAGSGREPAVPGRAGAAVLDLVEAAYRSAREGRRIALPSGRR